MMMQGDSEARRLQGQEQEEGVGWTGRRKNGS